MSERVYFSMSSGLKRSVKAPKGSFSAIMKHVRDVEGTLGIQRETYNGVERWDYWAEPFKTTFAGFEDELLCRTVEKHNRWVRWIYGRLAAWADGRDLGPQTEEITPEDAVTIWPALHTIDVPPDRWTADYYQSRMDHLYEVMRGREDEGVSFDERALTPKQAGAVVRLFEKYLGVGDLRLEVIKGEDCLSSGEDYTWCTRCGAVSADQADGCRRRKCLASHRTCPKCEGLREVEANNGVMKACGRCSGEGMLYA